MKLTDFKVLAFDVYGTLIDWESGMVTALKPLTDKVSQNLTRDDILEAHAYHESTTQRWTPNKKYFDLLAVVYRRLAEEWGVEVTWEECQAYGLSVRQWPAFDDSRHHHKPETAHMIWSPPGHGVLNSLKSAKSRLMSVSAIRGGRCYA